MEYSHTIEWDNLPHHNQVGHGVEGLILRFDGEGERCIKVYSPDRARFAEKEYENYQTLLEAGFLVPKVRAFVEVHIGGKKVKLPGKCEFMGIGLYNFSEIESVPGIIKEFFPGRPFGSRRHGFMELRGLRSYLDKLHKAELTFDDGRASDFISTNRGVALVDCSTLMNKDECAKRWASGFEYASSRFQKGILEDLRNN